MNETGSWQAAVIARCEKDLLTPTRIHPLRNFGPHVWIKREDENGFGISGCKKRKYASLLPWLEQQNPRKALLIGGARSNHISGFLQLLNEKGFETKLYLKENHSPAAQGGNAFLTSLLSSPGQIRTLSKSEWPQAAEIAASENPEYQVIPEGGTCLWALPGACTLMSDIIRNETESGIFFDHIIIDSGTALMATSLIWMNALAGRKSQIHCVMMAGDEPWFQQQMEQVKKWFQELFPAYKLPEIPPPLLYFPSSGRAFGSVTQSVKDEILRMAREEGILTDPVYTAKLCMTARQIIQQQSLTGNILIIHSGGGSGLMGFSGIGTDR
ncbi:MAG: pyridoxal-phosphate dependent enzyme [Bacteroidetes bacterium]|nr:MAG: pyridoxal-phosphate dependent enzyme [Bacteroidota bacterium]